jgi:hypothetical protein
MKLSKSLFAGLIAILLLPLTVGVLAAGTLPTPSDRPLLTVSGDISVTNVGDTAQFDLEMLQSMELLTFETTTIWTAGTKTFAGVSLFALLEQLGVSSGTLMATAINDYSVEIPVADINEHAPIIAFSMDGNLMSRRDKGPLWIVYPYDSDAMYRSETVYSRSIWQLDRIEVLQ